MLKYLIRGLLVFASNSEQIAAVIDEPARALRAVAKKRRALAARLEARAAKIRTKALTEMVDSQRADRIADRLVELTA